jgi:hypothetical protein
VEFTKIGGGKQREGTMYRAPTGARAEAVMGVVWHGMVGSVTLGTREVKDPLLGLVLGGLGFEGDGAVGVEELVGDVTKDGGAARGDAAFGNKDQEPCEELVDVNGGLELGELGEKFGGEVFRVVLDGHGNGSGGVWLPMTDAKARVNLRAGEAAALAVGIKIRTAGRSAFRRNSDRIGGEVWASDCSVHELFLFLVEGGTLPHSCMSLKTKGLKNGLP